MFLLDSARYCHVCTQIAPKTDYLQTRHVKWPKQGKTMPRLQPGRVERRFLENAAKRVARRCPVGVGHDGKVGAGRFDVELSGSVETWGGRERRVGGVQGAVPHERHNGHCLTTLGRGRRHRTKRRSLAVKRPMPPPSRPKTLPAPPSVITRPLFCSPIPIQTTFVCTRGHFCSRRYARCARYGRRCPVGAGHDGTVTLRQAQGPTGDSRSKPGMTGKGRE